MTNIPGFVVKISDGRVSIIGDQVYLDGTPAHNVVANRIFELWNAGSDPRYLMRFLASASENPSPRALSELWPFLENKGLPITEDGCFLAYKNVTSDYKDNYTKSIDMSIGTRPVMKREACENWGIECGEGFHIGAQDYLRTWSYYKEDGRVIIAKINPRDVVSVPRSELTKLRCCTFQSFADWPEKLNASLDSSKVYQANKLEPVIEKKKAETVSKPRGSARLKKVIDEVKKVVNRKRR